MKKGAVESDSSVIAISESDAEKNSNRNCTADDVQNIDRNGDDVAEFLNLASDSEEYCTVHDDDMVSCNRDEKVYEF